MFPKLSDNYHVVLPLINLRNLTWQQLKLNSDERQWVVTYGGLRRPSRFTGRQHNSPALITRSCLYCAYKLHCPPGKAWWTWTKLLTAGWCGWCGRCSVSTDPVNVSVMHVVLTIPGAPSPAPKTDLFCKEAHLPSSCMFQSILEAIDTRWVDGHIQE